MTAEDYLCSDSFLYAVLSGATLPEGRHDLDGPELARWIECHFADIRGRLAPNLYRTLCRWKAGATASEQLADRVLVILGGHLVELPAEFWIANPRAKAGRKAAA